MSYALFACDADRVVRAALQLLGVGVNVIEGGIQVIDYAHVEPNWIVRVANLHGLGECLDCSYVVIR